MSTCAGCINGLCSGNCHKTYREGKAPRKYNNKIKYTRIDDIVTEVSFDEPPKPTNVIPYANIIEALEYLKADPTTTFTHPLSYTPIMINMLTDEDKEFLRSFKHLKYNNREKRRAQTRLNNKNNNKG